MPQMATITVNDGTTPTPVAHAYDPVRIIAPDTATYKNFADASDVARETLRVKALESKDSKLRTVTMVLMVPYAITETINGVSRVTVEDFQQWTVTARIPRARAASVVKNGRVLTANLLLNASMAEILDDGKFVY